MEDNGRTAQGAPEIGLKFKIQMMLGCFGGLILHLKCPSLRIVIQVLVDMYWWSGMRTHESSVLSDLVMGFASFFVQIEFENGKNKYHFAMSLLDLQVLLY